MVNRRTYPLKPPDSVKIAAAVAERAGTLQAARVVLQESAGTAKPKNLLKYLRRAPKVAPAADDRA